MVERKLTGRMRYRTHKRWRGEPLLVAQVEVHASGYYIDHTGTMDVDDTYWRDATVSDFIGLLPTVTSVTTNDASE